LSPALREESLTKVARADRIASAIEDLNADAPGLKQRGQKGAGARRRFLGANLAQCALEPRERTFIRSAL